MQRKAYAPGAVVLLAALLAACTGSSGNGDAAEDSKAGGVTASATAAQPGKYRTLSDACGTVDHDILDSLLPGIKQTADQEQRDKSYQGEAVPTYNNDRRSGCRWKAESTGATDRLYVDLERVVSYDNAVSDDNRAHDVYFTKEEAANLPEPISGAAGGSASDGPAPTTSAPPSAGVTPSGTATASPPASASAPASGSPSATGTAADLRPRTLDDLGDEAFLDDRLSTAEQRTVTVVFRTSNVIVTIEYDEQPSGTAQAPDSKDMQDRARKLARQLAGSLG
ncbi:MULTISPECIES: DUF3558 domain-containing protein [unclassified Streptomyces]|uniref:DUF3558 domain-containing protein n=1 Tax=unclassified Streptomyces TaxID=2593676 RepID=UPI0033BE02EA